MEKTRRDSIKNMSMHDTKSSLPAEDEDDAGIEAEIERELQALDPTKYEGDDSTEEEETGIVTDSSDSDAKNASDEDLSVTMRQYLEQMKSQTDRLQEELEECDDLLQRADIVSTPCPHHADLLELARETGQDPESLKRQVLLELDQEDEEDLRFKSDSVIEDIDASPGLLAITDSVYNLSNAEPIYPLINNAVSDENVNAFLTAIEEPKEETSLDTEEQPLRETAPSTGPQQLETTDINPCKLEPGEGNVIEMIEPEVLEQRIRKDIVNWEEQWLQRNKKRQEEVSERLAEEKQLEEEANTQRRQKEQLIKKEQEKIKGVHEVEDNRLRRDAAELQKKIEESLQKYEVEIEILTKSARLESAALKKAQEEGRKREEERQHKAATKVQAAYRGYRVYKVQGVEVKAHLSHWRQEKMDRRIRAIEESRKKKLEEERLGQEALKKQEDDRIRREEEKKRQKEEEKKRKEEEIKQQEMEAERKKQEEEDRKKKQLEQQKRQEEEEERKRKQLEQQKRQEEEMKRKEEEKKRLEEERQREEDRKREEEENRKQEAEQRKRLEERQREERQTREEENRRQEEEQRKRAAEDQQRLEEERQQKEEEAKRKREEEEEEEGIHRKEEAIKTREDEERKQMDGEKEELECLQRKTKTSPHQATEGSQQSKDERMKMISGGSPMHSPVPPEGRPRTPRKNKIQELRKSTSPLVNGSCSGPQSRSDLAMHSTSSDQDDQQRVSMEKRRTPLSARSDVTLTLPDLIEKKRLDWIQNCQSWSKTANQLKVKKPITSGRKPPRRPISAKNLSPLTEERILSAANVTSLQKVTTVELHDLPGCTIKALGQCSQLRSLRVNHCGLATTEGLEACKELTYIDLQHNSLEAVTLHDLTKLTYVNLAHNCLTALHGLDGCTNLRCLRAAHNRMTRICGLEGLTSLHTLDLSNNQLITCRGISAAPTVQVLDLSRNHLPSMDDIKPLGLLQTLRLTGNNIMQPPLLTNQVLLKELLLNDNSLCSLHNISESWLPLLRRLSVAQNSLVSVDSLRECLLLEDLDLSNNQILDMQALVPGLQACSHLVTLQVDGNPVSEEANSSLQKLIPSLQFLDGASMPRSECTLPAAVTAFQSMCSEQLRMFDQLDQQYQATLKASHGLETLCSIHPQFFIKSHDLAVEYRYLHEYGETSMAPTSQNIDFDLSLSPGAAKENQSNTSEMKNKFEVALQNQGTRSSYTSPSVGSAEQKQQSHLVTSTSAARNSLPTEMMDKIHHDETLGKRERALQQNTAATQIQARWRGYCVRRDIDLHMQRWIAATTIQANWRGHFIRKLLREAGVGFPQSGLCYSHETAAIKIQALWRGYRHRKRIQNAMNYAKMSFDDDLDDELNFKEVDLSAFDFNEDDLEKGWTPPETPQLPANNHNFQKSNISHAVIGKTPSSNQAMAAKAAFDAALGSSGGIPLFDHAPHPPSQPRHAWRNLDSPLSDIAQYKGRGRASLAPVSRMSDHSETESQHTGTLTHRTALSKKEEKLSEEWGFKDSRTAELMMQRAKKLKYNVDRKKKLSQLDPKQRLALYRKLEQTTTLTPVQPSPKKVLPRKEYFQAREDEAQQQQQLKQRDVTDHRQRTYEWLHTQVSPYEMGSSRINHGLTETLMYANEGNLPQIDANIIDGARPTLTGSPLSADLQSLDSASSAGDQVRRHSLGAQAGSRLPPIKVSSAPSATIHERMSFRNPKPKNAESVGWGGGRKRNERR